MSDARLRELERRWRESGAVEDEAALLRERLRQGALGSSRLELAADLGHPGAASALGRAPASAAALVDPGWAVRTAAAGAEAAVRCAAAAARACLPLHRWHRPGDDVPERVLETVEAWLDCPCPPHTRAAAAWALYPAAPPGLAGLGYLAHRVARVVGAQGEPGGARVTVRELEAVVAQALERLGEEALQEVLRDAVAAWAVGHQQRAAG